MHQCLRDNRDKLSEACRREETKLQIIESSNTELMPNLARACKARPCSPFLTDQAACYLFQVSHWAEPGASLSVLTCEMSMKLLWAPI